MESGICILTLDSDGNIDDAAADSPNKITAKIIYR